MSTKEKMRAFRRLSERALQASRLVSRGLRESISATQAFLFASAPLAAGHRGVGACWPGGRELARRSLPGPPCLKDLGVAAQSWSYGLPWPRPPTGPFSHKRGDGGGLRSRRSPAAVPCILLASLFAGPAEKCCVTASRQYGVSSLNWGLVGLRLLCHPHPHRVGPDQSSSAAHRAVLSRSQTTEPGGRQMPLCAKAFSSAAARPPAAPCEGRGGDGGEAGAGTGSRPALSLVLGETGTLKIPPREVHWLPACSVAVAVDLKCLPGSPSSAQQTAAFAY